MHEERQGLKDSRSHNGWRRNFSGAFAARGCSAQSIDARAHSCAHKLNRLGMIGSSDLDVHIAPWPRSYEPSEQQKHARARGARRALNMADDKTISSSICARLHCERERTRTCMCDGRVCCAEADEFAEFALLFLPNCFQMLHLSPHGQF